MFAGVSVTGLWPATVIESHVTTVQNLPTQYMRTAHIFADAVLKIGQEPTQRQVAFQKQSYNWCFHWIILLP